MENKHIAWIDWAKSIGIFIVVLCHVPQYDTVEKEIFCSFQMPLFFFLSGYLYKIPQGTFKDELMRNWKTLIIPYFLFQILFYPYWLVVQKVNGYEFSFYTIFVKPITDCLIGIPINGVTWFIIALLIIKLYAFFILRLRRKWLWVILSCLLVGTARYIMYMGDDSIKISFAIDSAMHFFLFFFLGYYFKASERMELLVNSKLRLYYILTLSFIMTFVGAMAQENQSVSLQEILHYTLGVSGTMTVLSVCILFDKVNSSIIRTISSGTIVVFGLHWMFIGTINFILKKHWDIIGEIQYSTTMAICIALFIIFLNYFIIIFCKKHFEALLGYRK